MSARKINQAKECMVMSDKKRNESTKNDKKY